MKNNQYLLLGIIFSLFFLPSGVKARDLDEYWYGIGVGTSELLCTFKNNGLISNSYMNLYMKDYLRNAENLDKKLVRLDKFKDGIELVNSLYTSCNLRS